MLIRSTVSVQGALFSALFHPGQVLGIQPYGPADGLVLGGGQVLAGFGFLQNTLAVVLEILVTTGRMRVEVIYPK